LTTQRQHPRFSSAQSIDLNARNYYNVTHDVRLLWALSGWHLPLPAKYISSGGFPMETLMDDRKIKQLFKQAIIETMEERRDLVHDLLLEVMEDIALVRAIQEGENSEIVEREEIFQILDGKESNSPVSA
jgi:hypothetical protein